MASEQADRPFFSSAALRRLILPLMAEQLLAVTVGMADTVMVSSVGEAAVSGISLVDQINVLLIQILSALATGGAVVVSQYLGRRDAASARSAAKQLLYITAGCAAALAAVAVLANRLILRAVFGSVEPAVMQAAETYFWLSALSYPMLAVYNAGAALFRSMGNSKISLYASLLMNVVNIGGNAFLIYGRGMGVAGAAIASLAARTLAAAMMVVLLHSHSRPIYLEHVLRVELHPGMIRGILRVGVPTGLENGMFQVGKLMVAGLVASFGTVSIAANAICNSLGSFCNLPGVAIGLAMVTVVGQCVGAGDYAAARRYTRKLVGLSFAAMGVTNAAIFLLARVLALAFSMSAEITDLAVVILRGFCVGCVIFWPPSFALPNALRAAGDARFTMIVSAASMWAFRIGFSYVLGLWLGWGLVGVWTAMIIDWVARDVAFLVRFAGHRWEKARVLND